MKNLSLSASSSIVSWLGSANITGARLPVSAQMRNNEAVTAIAEEMCCPLVKLGTMAIPLHVYQQSLIRLANETQVVSKHKLTVN